MHEEKKKIYATEEENTIRLVKRECVKMSYSMDTLGNIGKKKRRC